MSRRMIRCSPPVAGRVRQRAGDELEDVVGGGVEHSGVVGVGIVAQRDVGVERGVHRLELRGDVDLLGQIRRALGQQDGHRDRCRAGSILLKGGGDLADRARKVRDDVIDRDVAISRDGLVDALRLHPRRDRPSPPGSNSS